MPANAELIGALSLRGRKSHQARTPRRDIGEGDSAHNSKTIHHRQSGRVKRDLKKEGKLFGGEVALSRGERQYHREGVLGG